MEYLTKHSFVLTCKTLFESLIPSKSLFSLVKQVERVTIVDEPWKEGQTGFEGDKEISIHFY